MRTYTTDKGLIRSRGKGFTLIELLVVLTIVGILAGLLLPVLHTARKRAWESTCLSNMKQLGQAFFMYYHDYDERSPDNAGDLWPYTQNWEIFRCPADPSDKLNLSEYFLPPVARLSYGYHLGGYYTHLASTDPRAQQSAASITRCLQRRGEAFPVFWCRHHQSPGREVWILNRISGEVDRRVNPPVWDTHDL